VICCGRPWVPGGHGPCVPAQAGACPATASSPQVAKSTSLVQSEPTPALVFAWVCAVDAVARLLVSDSSSATDRGDVGPRRCFAQRAICRRLGCRCSLRGSGSEALRPSTTSPIVGRRRSPHPHRLRQQHHYGAPRSPRRGDSRTAGAMQQSATHDETAPSRPISSDAGVEAGVCSSREQQPGRLQIAANHAGSKHIGGPAIALDLNRSVHHP